jgi:hypothetical protein
MGDTGEGEAGDEAADAAPAGGDGEGGERRWPERPVVLAVGVIAGVVLIGGLALAARGGDPAPSTEASAQSEPSERSTSTTAEPVDTTGTTLAATTAPPAPPVTGPAPTTAPPPTGPPRSVPPATQTPPPPSRAASCAHPWPPPSGPLPTVFAPPGSFSAFGPPAASCVDVADGCLVSVTLRWSDGYTEVGSLVLAEPGQYTVNGDRGTSWTFTVDDAPVCISNGGNWSNVWPPGT